MEVLSVLFKRNYSIPGPGIDPDEPEKFGFARFCEILTLECRTVLKLNVITLFASLPLVTLPAALCAMNAVIRKMMLDQPVECLQDFRTAFAAFWKQSYLVFLLGTFVPVSTAVISFFYARMVTSNLLYFVPCVLSLFTFVASALMSAYLYPLSAAGLPFSAMLRRSLILGIAKPLRALLCFVVNVGLQLLTIWFFPLTLPYILLIGLTIPCFIGQFFVRLNLRKHALPVQEE